jgi:hypothetical protein
VSLLQPPDQLSNADREGHQRENWIDDELTAGPQETGTILAPDDVDQGKPDRETDQAAEKIRRHCVLQQCWLGSWQV